MSQDPNIDCEGSCVAGEEPYVWDSVASQDQMEPFYGSITFLDVFPPTPAPQI